jgi:hypothetical protein
MVVLTLLAIEETVVDVFDLNKEFDFVVGFGGTGFEAAIGFLTGVGVAGFEEPGELETDFGFGAGFGGTGLLTGVVGFGVDGGAGLLTGIAGFGVDGGAGLLTGVVGLGVVGTGGFGVDDCTGLLTGVVGFGVDGGAGLLTGMAGFGVDDADGFGGGDLVDFADTGVSDIGEETTSSVNALARTPDGTPLANMEEGLGVPGVDEATDPGFDDGLPAILAGLVGDLFPLILLDLLLIPED